MLNLEIPAQLVLASVSPSVSQKLEEVLTFSFSLAF